MKVSDILRVKGNTLFTVSPDQPLPEAVTTMAEHDIGSLVVMDHGDLIGMLTFREVIRPPCATAARWGTATIRAVMDDAPLTCTPETEIDEVRRMMLGRHARYMPVLQRPDADGRDLVLRRRLARWWRRRTSRTACSRPTSAIGLPKKYTKVGQSL